MPLMLEEKCRHHLLTAGDMGDRTPSQYLRHLRTLAGPIQLPENFLRKLSLQRLPPPSRLDGGCSSSLRSALLMDSPKSQE